MHGTTQSTGARATTGVPFDIQSVDELCDLLGEGVLPGVLPAVLLDCDRRGKRFADLAAALVEALRQTALSDLEGSDRLYDLLDACLDWGIDLSVSDPILVSAFGDLSALDGMDGYRWVEALGSMDREGYSLEWMARRLAARSDRPWADTVARANAMLVQRRDGTLRANILGPRA
jgi:hypothetical protein